MTLTAPPDQDIVIAGATGDLARRRLLPAVYNLFLDGRLPRDGMVFGYARTELDEGAFHELAANAIRDHSRRPLDDDAWALFRRRLAYVSGHRYGMSGIAERARKARRIVVLAIPPSAFMDTITDLAVHDLVDGTRLLIEKPFGDDLRSSRRLDAHLHEHFDESQVFRIDHYLGKETVQNIIVFRFGNALFERVWDRDAIDHVQITVAESEGVGTRGSFYEEVGALRDIIQNHVLQMLALLTMEPPASLHADAIHDEKHKLLSSIPPVAARDVVFGQYDAGTVEGDAARAYREEDGVAPGSRTETFAALRLTVDNWRWSGVPFYLRSGKRLPRRVTELHVQFRDAPVMLFEEVLGDHGGDRLTPNHLTMRIQPDEGITLSFQAKAPGPEFRLHPVRMSFSYEQSLDHAADVQREAYERLLLDAMEGDRTLFLRGDTVDRSWQLVQPVLDAMPSPHAYAAGSWGPAAADELIAPRTWHLH